jgi:phospholipase/carboxylesterase
MTKDEDAAMLLFQAIITAAAILVAALQAAPLQMEQAASTAANPELLSLPDGAVALIPKSASTGDPPLLVLLHGAGETPVPFLAKFREVADRTGAIILAPQSRNTTWDIIGKAELAQLGNDQGPDGIYRYSGSRDADRVASAIDALARIKKTDPARRVLLGFSDGATFALGLGTDRRLNYSAVIAIAPGIATVASKPAKGRDVIILHGRQDQTLPIEVTRTTIVPALRSARLKVSFVQFDGGHSLPPDLPNYAEKHLVAP